MTLLGLFCNNILSTKKTLNQQIEARVMQTITFYLLNSDKSCIFAHMIHVGQRDSSPQQPSFKHISAILDAATAAYFRRAIKP